MALVRSNRVRETSTTTGTGTVTLDGPVSGFRSFSSGIGIGNTCFYVIALDNEFEVGVGTLTSATTLSRDIVLDSSNSGALVNFPVGSKNIFVDEPSQNFKTDSSGILTLSGGGTGVVTIPAGQYVKGAGTSPVTSSATIPNTDITGLGTMSTQNASSVAITGGSITGLSAPVNPSDAVTKAYADALKAGLDIKDSVRLATTANIDLTTGTLLTIDGVVTVAGNRVLVKNQTTASQNGIYVASAGAWTRSTDADADVEVTSGLYTFVSEGTVNASNGFVLITADPIVLGTTALTFTQFSGAGQIVAGAGLTKTGNTLDVVGTAGRIVVAADSIDLATTGVSAGTFNSVTVDTYGRVTAASNTAAATVRGTVWTARVIGTEREMGITYTNSTGKTIVVNISAVQSGGSSTAITAAVGGVVVGQSNSDSPGTVTYNFNCTMEVVNGATYVVGAGSSGWSLQRWSELI